MASDDDENQDDQRPDSDYDGAWKELLRSHLKEVIRECFPQLAAVIDWNIDPEWLDKEISQIIGQSRHRNRSVDILFRVRLISGQIQWVLCHLEIQTYYEADFASRIDLYNSGVKWMFQQEVVTLVILADLNPNWRPSEYHFELVNYRSDRQFPICKILDRLSTDWIQSTSLISLVARAQIAALQTASDPDARFSAKTQLVRNLYTMGFTSDRIRETFRLVDWMMLLRSDLERRFKAELVAYEEELRMPYVTSIERLAKEELMETGREEGREQGSAALLLRMLERKCGPLPADISERIHRLKLQQSLDLGEALFDFQSLEELINWMNQIE